MTDRQTTLPDGTYVVLVQSLFATLIPSLIMAAAFLGIAAHIAIQTPDWLLGMLGLLGGGAIIARLAVLLLYRGRACSETLDLAGARQIERLFAVPYFAFSLIFGAFSARAFQIASTEAHMLIVGLLFGYGAGVAAGIFLRPWIALPSAALAIAPSIAVALMTPDWTYFIAGLLLLLFLGGGIQSMMRNFGKATAEITSRRTFAMLARADALTGLDNRLSLREAFDMALPNSGRKEMLVVHCLDLDRFKAVNDTFGHPVGDALLQAVADRLQRALRNGDIAARVGGDEFVIVQTGAQHPSEAELFARRIARAVAEPYSILGEQLTVGTSVGYAVYPDHGRDLDELMARADEALIHVKRAGGGIELYHPQGLPEPLKLSA